MSQWNNSYSYNGQYQANGWNRDVNGQYSNSQYYNNRQDSNNQYVSFNEFLTQIQGDSASVPGNSVHYNNVRYENYPTTQYNYQNMPSTSQNRSLDSYNYPTNVNPRNPQQYQMNMQNQYVPSESYNNEIILKSNLTPTATEFVPKSMAKQITGHQSLAEPATNNVKHNDANWRERESLQQNGEIVTNQVSENNKSQYSKTQNRVPNSQDNAHSSESNVKVNEPRHRNGHRNNEANGSYYNQNNQSESKSHSNEINNHSDSSSRYYENQRNYDRNEKKIISKTNPKSKPRDADARTFYNSSITKDSQDVRNGRGESSGRQRNWAGSQRIKSSEKSTPEDEQYATSYTQQKQEKVERNKTENIPSPNRFRSKNIEQAINKEMTQRERLTDQLEKGTLECLVCCERVKQTESVWSCGNCYHVLHLRCIRKWAMSSLVEGKWRCPACQNSNETIPTACRCMCGAIRSPEYQRGVCVAHTCGKQCRRPRACPHPCTLLCHPGPCPPCQATVTKECGCGAETRSVMCSSKLPQVCGRPCQRMLQCGVHKCMKECHEGPCEDCTESVTQVCHCPLAKTREVACRVESSWSCGGACGRVLSCGAHVCRSTCHEPPCPSCDLLPAALITCPCGKTRIPKDKRKSCTDPIPLCGNICAKPLPCGPAGDKHFCKLDCHEGPCPVCPDKTLLPCRCGHSNREVPCAELPDMYNNVFCQKKCNKKLSCGRHRCRACCCADPQHRCGLVCGRSLACQTHRCQDFCHTGHCAPCPTLSFEELSCTCGREVLLPPVRCGTRPPPCSAPCRRARPCGHEPLHSCHTGDCPPCVVLTTRTCHGGHEERKTIPCSQEEFSCGLPCGKPLPCGKHTCIKVCHKGPCDAGKCTQPCNEKRASCGHPCGAACHSGAAGGAGALCPSAAPCRRTVRATCPCKRKSAERPCFENARDYDKMMSALAATKIQEGGSVDLSDAQRAVNMLKTLECDDECRVEARTRQMALALQIRNPDVSAKLAPRYSEHVRATAQREPAFAYHVHNQLTELVHLAKKSKQKTRSHSFPSMNRQKRQFIHELCEHFGCESVAYDAEPNRNVVATADKEKSWLPAMSIMEVLSREAGRRRVPGPVLRTAHSSAASSASTTSSSAANKSPGGWATLTSSNAWASRSQPKQTAAEPKIDYFDNPPEN
ncbi:protein shuttle craft [Bombyx mori]|uniref:Protein shuttle craft n=1 Tax=Bombyx mori TaxID=7091 RepID=A0A8R2RBZ1_BOMMO|nr:protein shuttle craft [Bombyx mori]